MPRGALKIPVPPPYQGLRLDLIPWQQPLETMVDGQNVVVRDRKLYVRSGYRKLTTTSFGERVMGGLFWKTANGTKRTVLAGYKYRKYYSSGTWVETDCGSQGAPGNGQTGRNWMRDSNENCTNPP